MDSTTQKITGRKSLRLEEKIDIINKFENGTQNWKLSKEYSVNSSTISTILNMKDKLKAYYQELKAVNGHTKRKCVYKPEYQILEEALYAWICQKRTIGQPVSGIILHEKAKIFYTNLKNEGHVPADQSEFKASDGWLSKFKDRHGLRTLQPKGEKVSADTVGSEKFIVEFSNFLLENNYELDNVYNADESGLYYRSLPNKTLVLASEIKVAGHKPIKERLTITVCSNASGSHQIPILVIGKSAVPRCFKKVQSLPLDYTNQKKAWMNSEIFLSWFKDIFLKSVKELKPDARIVLLLDNAPTHPSAKKLNAIDDKCKVIYLPPNVTSLIQPMDQGVISALKRRYKMGFVREMLALNHSNSNEWVQFIKKWTVLDCMKFLKEAWISLTPNTLRNAWKNLINTSQSNSHVTTCNNELIQLLNRVPGGSSCSATDVENWLEAEEEINLPVFKIVSDEELLNTYAGLQLPVPDEEETQDSCEETEKHEETVSELLTADFILNSAQCIVDWSRKRLEFSEEERLIFIKAHDRALNFLLEQN